MSWTDNLPLQFDEYGAKELEDLMEMAYYDSARLMNISRSAGLEVGYIYWHQPVSLLPMQIMQQAANQGKMVPLIAELISDKSIEGYHKDIWQLLDEETAQKVYRQAINASPSFKRRAQLADGIKYKVNNKASSLEKIVNKMAAFQDSALLRFQLAKCEARVVRFDINQKGYGTGWLVGPDLILTNQHVLGKANGKLNRVTIRCDYKYIPKHGGIMLYPGRIVKLAENPVLASSKHEHKNVELSENGVEISSPPLLDFALLKLAEPIGAQGLGENGQGNDKRGWYQLPDEPYDYDEEDGLFVLGHPQLENDVEAGPLKLTLALPCGAELTENEQRLRYRVNTEGGNSGSPVLNQSLEPVALHHAGVGETPQWDETEKWKGGFNQGIPLDLIVKEIRRQVADEDTLASMGL